MGYSWFDYLYIFVSLCIVGLFMGMTMIVKILFEERDDDDRKGHPQVNCEVVDTGKIRGKGFDCIYVDELMPKHEKDEGEK